MPLDQYIPAAAGEVVGVAGTACPGGWVRYRVLGEPMFIGLSAVLDGSGSTRGDLGRPYVVPELPVACASRGTP